MSGETTGLASFVSTISSGLSADAIWGAILPVAGIIVIVTLVAIARRVLNKNLKSAKTGTSGKA